MPKTTQLKTMNRDPIKPSGTPVCVGATPEAVPEAHATSASCSLGETCFVHSTVILEVSTERGELVLLCEGRHKSWAHMMLGLGDMLYEDIHLCEMLWMH